MLSKKDYENHLAQMKGLEQKAVSIYKNCGGAFEDEDIKKTCLKIHDDELRHVAIVDELIRLMAN